MKPLSPKVLVPTVVLVAIFFVLFLLTKDTSYLAAIAVVLGGGTSVGVAVPPAPRVRQDDVQAVSEGKARIVHNTAPRPPRDRPVE